jgi:cytochrome c-type biogenesis protein CcmE
VGAEIRDRFGILSGTVHPQRKRRIRLVVALAAAVLLASALVYTSFSASTEAKQPSELVRVNDDRTYQLTGKVVTGSVKRDGEKLRFRVRDRKGNASVPVVYTGAVPDPFREGREVIVDVKRQGSVWIGEKDSLVTKCPSKFTEEKKT